MFSALILRDKWLEKIMKWAGTMSVADYGGVRVDFPDGWLLVSQIGDRGGNDLRIEADDDASMFRIKSLLAQALPQVKDKISG
jgi:hypothetical protein